MSRFLNSSVVDITPLTLLDYPGELSAIFWFVGCNLRCPYCYNPQFVCFEPGTHSFFSIASLRDFLRDRHQFLDAVVLSGGECTSAPEFIDVCHMIADFGLKIKVDTNGVSPQKIEALIAARKINAVALDFKAPFDKLSQFGATPDYALQWQETLHILCRQNAVPFEVRTTFHPSLLNESDLSEMAQFLYSSGYRGNYAIQSFFHGVPTLSISTEMQRPLIQNAIHSPLPLVFRP